MHEYYVFPTDCLDDLEDMTFDDRLEFLNAIVMYWSTEQVKNDVSSAVKIALRHAIREIEKIKEEIEG